jgi:predicted peroxiredoxin
MAVTGLTTGMEYTEHVTVAFRIAVGAAEPGRPTFMFLTKKAVRLAQSGFAVDGRSRRRKTVGAETSI